MIPAGYLARTGKLDPLLVVLNGGAGSLLGASANYLLGADLSVAPSCCGMASIC